MQDRHISVRRTDLDWVRIGAFALLIFYHVGMYYAPWDWEIKSPHILTWLEIPMDWSSPWRLLVLFVVSGAATRFMARRLTAPGLLRGRSERLLLPLLFGIFVAIPPQAYIVAVERYGYQGDFIAFWRRYLLADGTICRAGECMFMPDWKHLWFVAYLWVYTLAPIGLLAFAPGAIKRIEEWLRLRLSGWSLLTVPAAFFVFTQLSLSHFFPETDNFIGDWYRHANFFAAFAFGFFCADAEAIWNGFARYRWIALGIGLASYAIHMHYAWLYQSAPKPLALGMAMHVLYGIDQWAWVAAVFGFARRYLTSRDSATRRYLTEAIFPYYIIHQTAIIAAAYALTGFDLPVAVEATYLLAATVISCALTYEVARRIAWLRPWLGLKLAPPMAIAAAKASVVEPPLRPRNP